MSVLPATQHLQLERDQELLTLWFNRPEARNAMSLEMLGEIEEVLAAVADDRSIRTLVLRGRGGHFCAGGDIKDMARARQEPPTASADAVVDYSRAFGRMILAVNRAPQAVIGVLEGAVLGGGFGLACVTDVAIAHRDAKFGLPETGLGITPAQIAPMVVQRIGLTQARRLGVCGGRFDGAEARRLGLVHYLADDAGDIDDLVARVRHEIRRCAPQAVADTKALMLGCLERGAEENIEEAARIFAQGIRSAEGQEGTVAFVEKRRPSWAQAEVWENQA